MADTQQPETQNGAGAPLTEQVKQQTQQAVQQGQQYAGRAVDMARTQIKSQLAHQKDNLAVGVSDIAQIVKQSGDQIRGHGLGTLAGPYIDQAAEKLTNFGTNIQEKDVDEVIRETEAFARVQPALFLGGAAVLGFVAARFLKSSSDQAAAA